MKTDQYFKNIHEILNYKAHFTLKWGMTIIFLITATSLLLTTFIKYPSIVKLNSTVSIEYDNNAGAKYVVCKLPNPNNKFKVVTGQQIIINIIDIDSFQLKIYNDIINISSTTDTLMLTLKPNNISNVAKWDELPLKKEYSSDSELKLKDNTIFDMVIKKIPLFN